MSDRTFVTGFGPFAHVVENPSQKLASECGRPYRVLEVSYRAADEFLSGLDPNSFDILLMMGVASARNHFSVELFARNWVGNAKDVSGFGSEGLIEEGAPLLLESTLWTPELASGIVAYDPQTKVSMDAGEYLCNYIYYRALQKLPTKKIGFLHVPPESLITIEMQMITLHRVLDAVEG